MGRWVSWPIKGGSATSIFWKSGTVHRPRSLLNPDELTLLKLPHSVGQPIWWSIQWTIINPCSMDRLKSFKQCRSALAKAWLGSVEIIPWVVDHCQPECRWDQLNFPLFTKLPSSIQYYLHFLPMISSLGIAWPRPCPLNTPSYLC